jgi:hypothetical protein
MNFKTYKETSDWVLSQIDDWTHPVVKGYPTDYSLIELNARSKPFKNHPLTSTNYAEEINKLMASGSINKESDIIHITSKVIQRVPHPHYTASLVTIVRITETKVNIRNSKMSFQILEVNMKDDKGNVLSLMDYPLIKYKAINQDKKSAGIATASYKLEFWWEINGYYFRDGIMPSYFLYKGTINYNSTPTKQETTGLLIGYSKLPLEALGTYEENRSRNGNINGFNSNLKNWIHNVNGPAIVTFKSDSDDVESEYYLDGALVSAGEWNSGVLKDKLNLLNF